VLFCKLSGAGVCGKSVCEPAQATYRLGPKGEVALRGVGRSPEASGHRGKELARHANAR
jgi:hypothetical protein